MVPLLLVAYAFASLASFVLYGVDKRSAKTNGWRVSESTLHALALAGGWPGALAGQMAFRHKTVKRSFRRVFWLTVFGNCAIVGVLLALARNGTT